jgi:hypothetical protein
MAKSRNKTITVTTGSEFTWPHKLHGRRIAFKIQQVRNGIHISRVGRRGGIRGMEKTRGGMVACTARGAQSQCIRAQDIIISPGGGGRLRRGGLPVYGSYGRRRRRRR